jgi:hypothetical protein
MMAAFSRAEEPALSASETGIGTTALGKAYLGAPDYVNGHP